VDIPQEVDGMRVIIAARLSQLAGQTGIETQDLLSRKWAESNGHTVVDVIPDRKSGVTPPWKRPNLRPWVEDPAKMAQYDAVLAYRLDRLSRGDNASTNAIEKWAYDNGKQLLTEDGLYFPCEGADGIRWDVTKRIAHEEWLRASERYKRMQKHLRDSGYFVGRPPYGYQVTGINCGESPCTCKNDRKALEPDPVTGEIAREMVSWYIDGEPWAHIAQRLNARGLVTSQKHAWISSTVGRVLSSETLIGRRKDAQGKVILRFDPLIDMDTWGKLQAMLKRNALRRGSVRKDPGMLTSVVYCAKCKGIMHYRRKAPTPTYTWYGYRCDGTNENPSRCLNMINAQDLEGWVTMQMTGPPIGPLPVIETRMIPGDDHSEEVDQVEQELRDLDFDDPDFTGKQAGLLAERKRLMSLPMTPSRLDRQPTGETVAQRWLRLGDAERRDYLLRADVKVYAAGKTPTCGWRLSRGDPNILTA
jgi:DNA invertase Pin-like site-specific DNA recombinase